MLFFLSVCITNMTTESMNRKKYIVYTFEKSTNDNFFFLNLKWKSQLNIQLLNLT